MTWHGDEKPSWEEVFFQEPIHTYTRREAIQDGVLHDVTPHAELEGFRHPTAITDGVYVDAILQHCHGSGKPMKERLHQVLFEALQAMKRNKIDNAGRTYTRLPCVDGDGTPYLLDLIIDCHPGDSGETVVTIMRPEDV